MLDEVCSFRSAYFIPNPLLASAKLKQRVKFINRGFLFTKGKIETVRIRLGMRLADNLNFSHSLDNFK